MRLYWQKDEFYNLICKQLQNDGIVLSFVGELPSAKKLTITCILDDAQNLTEPSFEIALPSAISFLSQACLDHMFSSYREESQATFCQTIARTFNTPMNEGDNDEDNEKIMAPTNACS